MRLLITGGAGCLGYSMVNRWLQAGHDILVVDNFATSSKDSLATIHNLQVMEGSVADYSWLEKTVKDFSPSHIIHAAASYKDPQAWGDDIDVNTRGTANVIKLADECGAKKIIYLQTALCYGHPLETPIPESHPLAPITAYGISKTAGERLLILGNTPWISRRPSNIVAPSLSIGPIPTFYKRLKEGKSCFCSDTVRDFLDIDDFLDLLALCLESSNTPGIYNVSTGTGHSIRQVYDEVAAWLHSALPEPPLVPSAPDDIPSVVLDPSCANKIFGWKAKVTFPEMMAKMLHWYDQNGIKNIYSHLSVPDNSVQSRAAK